MNDVAKLLIDAYKNNVEKYSVSEANKAAKEALIDINNGKTYLDYKDIRDGKCPGLFTIIEEVLSNTVVEGLTNDMFFNTMVDFRNVALGDQNKFIVENDYLFKVANTAEGTQAVRRQRLGSQKEVTIETQLKTVKIYEELNRILAGRVDFNYMIGKVADSFKQQILNEIYTLWKGIVANDIGGTSFFPAAGNYSEATLLTLIEHVEAAADGKTPTIFGTKTAIRNLIPSTTAIISDGAKDDLYNNGYVGKFFGAPVIALPQRHKIGSTNFVLDDKMMYIVATDDKPIKMVYEGDPIVIPTEPHVNTDLTQEYLYGERYGLGLVIPANTGFGIYDIDSSRS